MKKGVFETPADYVSNGLRKFIPEKSGQNAMMFVSKENNSYPEQLAEFIEPKLKDKKAISGDQRYYFAMKPNGDHWSAAVLFLKKKNPRLFILDSIAQFDPNALGLLSLLMKKYGGHTYLCESGLQKDDENCATFTLYFLVTLSQHGALFNDLNKIRFQQHHEIKKQRSAYTQIPPLFLPSAIFRVVQSRRSLDVYMSQCPHEKEELEDFWENNKATDTYGKETSRAILNIRDGYEKTLGLSFRK